MSNCTLKPCIHERWRTKTRQRDYHKNQRSLYPEKMCFSGLSTLANLGSGARGKRPTLGVAVIGKNWSNSMLASPLSVIGAPSGKSWIPHYSLFVSFVIEIRLHFQVIVTNNCCSLRKHNVDNLDVFLVLVL